ncbi:hypothetical protein TrLO_g9144 [Triparma laevis f. longispina]|uniref:Myb-like domain-containing protein n=1 Tax=Triparma laevis f. longispina TaxID=1714387 RepID=A0A9W7A0S0_9STRA|nr:hypothetical protein TrLO_g9144 [Triparma laevis f. longispina]
MGRPGPVLPSGAIAQIGNNGRAVNMLNKPSEKVVAASVELNTHTKRKLQDTILKNTLVEQPPKKKTRKWNVDGDPWTLEENTALLSGTKKHGLNFDRIKADNEVIFKLRTVRSLYSHLQDEYPKEFEAIKAASLKNSRSGSKYPWTDEEDEALVKGVDKHGLNFSRIRSENDSLLSKRTTQALDNHYRRAHPKDFKNLRAATPKIYNNWTPEEDAALKRGIVHFDFDWQKIHQEENKILGRRTPVALASRYYSLIRL